MTNVCNALSYVARYNSEPIQLQLIANTVFGVLKRVLTSDSAEMSTKISALGACSQIIEYCPVKLECNVISESIQSILQKLVTSYEDGGINDQNCEHLDIIRWLPDYFSALKNVDNLPAGLLTDTVTKTMKLIGLCSSFVNSEEYAISNGLIETLSICLRMVVTKKPTPKLFSEESGYEDNEEVVLVPINTVPTPVLVGCIGHCISGLKVAEKDDYYHAPALNLLPQIFSLIDSSSDNFKKEMHKVFEVLLEISLIDDTMKMSQTSQRIRSARKLLNLCENGGAEEDMQMVFEFVLHAVTQSKGMVVRARRKDIRKAMRENFESVRNQCVKMMIVWLYTFKESLPESAQSFLQKLSVKLSEPKLMAHLVVALKKSENDEAPETLSGLLPMIVNTLRSGLNPESKMSPPLRMSMVDALAGVCIHGTDLILDQIDMCVEVLQKWLEIPDCNEEVKASIIMALARVFNAIYELSATEDDMFGDVQRALAEKRDHCCAWLLGDLRVLLGDEEVTRAESTTAPSTTEDDEADEEKERASANSEFNEINLLFACSHALEVFCKQPHLQDALKLELVHGAVRVACRQLLKPSMFDLDSLMKDRVATLLCSIVRWANALEGTNTIYAEVYECFTLLIKNEDGNVLDNGLLESVEKMLASL
eukprot:TRINITY_DN1506_c0_g4_i3.p1 TRINITY_DN1506_c0_g4~~TRINITY_DN1506_c0_g4_i3.p1  ORF type:complete len:652 (-),score=199.28 TRINITY_DN1506_c0_g4_i3:218-2173(-)